MRYFYEVYIYQESTSLDSSDVLCTRVNDVRPKKIKNKRIKFSERIQRNLDPF